MTLIHILTSPNISSIFFAYLAGGPKCLRDMAAVGTSLHFRCPKRLVWIKIFLLVVDDDDR